VEIITIDARCDAHEIRKHDASFAKRRVGRNRVRLGVVPAFDAAVEHIRGAAGAPQISDIMDGHDFGAEAAPQALLERSQEVAALKIRQRAEADRVTASVRPKPGVLVTVTVQ
jgi:hypothetical protein